MGGRQLILNRLLGISWIYQAWQAPFVNKKLAPAMPFIERCALDDGKVLEIGCGPGINGSHFVGANYVGFDLSVEYVKEAQRRLPTHHFICADATAPFAFPPHFFDLCFVNSLLHHLSDDGLRSLMENIASVLHPSGELLIIDLILPECRSISRLLAKMDRGSFARPASEWRSAIEKRFRVLEFQPFEVRLGTVPLWKLFFCRAVPNHDKAK